MQDNKPVLAGLEHSLPTRLLYVTTSDVSLILLRGQLRFLRDAGFEVSAISSPGRSLDAASEAEGVQTHAVPMVREVGGLADILSLWRLWRLMRRYRPVITNVSTPKAGLLGGLASYLSGVPCRIYTLRGLRCETATGLKRWALLFAERVACQCAHRVICVSESLRQKAVALAVVDPGCAVVLGPGSSNGVDPDRFAPTVELLGQAAPLRRALGIPPDAPVIGFVGRFTRDKGVSELVQAFCQLHTEYPELRLLLVGDFEDGDPVSDQIRSMVASDPHIIFTGTVRDTAPYYHLMDILALPTYREGFPNAVIEAHAAAKPVVTTDATGAVDAVLDGITGIQVPVRNAGALAEALAGLLANPQVADRMGLAGREHVMREFRQEIIWMALEEEYLNLLRAKGMPLPQVRARQELQALASSSGFAPR